MKKAPIRTQALLLISLILMVSMISFMKTSVTAATPPDPEIAVINPQNPVNPLAKDGNFVFYTNTTSVGYKFNATVWVYNVTDLYSYQVKLAYDPGPPLVINVTRAWVPDWDAKWVFYGKNTFSPEPTIVYEFGSYVLVGSLLLSGTAFSGTGILAVIEFEIRFAPTPLGKVFRGLTIDNGDTFLLDSDGNDISAVKMNGYYKYVWLEPGLEVKTEPSPYVAVNLETFNMSVWLNDVTISDRLVSLKFKLRYNATLLNVTKVTEGPFMPRFGTTTFNYVDDKVENLTITNYLNPPYGTSFPEGNGTIAIITLQGIYQDFYKDLSCPLELIPMQFLNDSGNPITYSPSINGSYTILRNRSSYITIKVAPTSVVIGSNATISGTIKPSKVDVNVTIYYRLVGQSWSNLTTVKTGPASDYAYNLTTSVVGTFEFKANWTGDASHNSSESGIATLVVKKLASAISIDVNPSTVTVGTNVTISGAITPTRASVTVTIYFRLTGGAWNTLPTVQTNSTSQYTSIWTTTEGGTYELYASWPGDNVTLGAVSSTKALIIQKFPSSIALNISPFNTTVTVGSKITMNGTVTANGTPKSGVDVNIYLCYYHPDLNATMKDRIAVKTDSNGNYNYTWTATKRTLAENDTFFFYADWPGDTTTSGNYSFSAVWLTVFKENSTITLYVNPVTVHPGSNVALSGTITPTKTNTKVMIYYRPAEGNWSTLATIVTSSSSIYNFAWTSAKMTFNSSETFEFKARWLGDVNTKAAESDIKTVIVEKIKSIITIDVSSSTITISSNVTISGVITPTRTNVNVTIFYREKGTTVQSSLLAKTSSEGHYNYTWKPMKNATFELYAWWSGDENIYSNESDIVTIKVNLIKSNITINVYPEATTVGSNITISGTIIPTKTGVEVSIYYRLKVANQSWIQLGTTTLGLNGNYTYKWTTTKVGTFELEARWPGDNSTESAKSETKIVKVEEPFSLINYLLYILAGATITIIALAVAYLTKIRKREAHN